MQPSKEFPKNEINSYFFNFSNFYFQEKILFSEGLDNNLQINNLLLKLLLPYNTAVRLIRDIELLEKLTFYNFKRIYLPKNNNEEILFCCSSICSKNSKFEKEKNLLISEKETETNSNNIKSISDPTFKINVCETCPMRLKFKFDKIEKKYFFIFKESNLIHNHYPLFNNQKVKFFYL